MFAQFKIEVYLDEQQVALMGNFDYFIYKATARNYLLKAFEPKYKIFATAAIEDTGNCDRYYRFEVKATGIGVIQLSEVNEATWKSDIARLKLRPINIDPAQ